MLVMNDTTSETFLDKNNGEPQSTVLESLEELRKAGQQTLAAPSFIFLYFLFLP